jgi:hypothetical protein
MSVMHLLVALSTLAAVPAGSPQAPAVPAPTQVSPAQRTPPPAAQPPAPGQARSPYDGIFAPADKPRLRVELGPGPSGGYGLKPPSNEPAIICGTVILRPDPLMDPKMPLPKLDPGVTYTIRALPPPICRG